MFRFNDDQPFIDIELDRLDYETKYIPRLPTKIKARFYHEKPDEDLYYIPYYTLFALTMLSVNFSTVFKMWGRVNEDSVVAEGLSKSCIAIQGAWHLFFMEIKIDFTRLEYLYKWHAVPIVVLRLTCFGMTMLLFTAITDYQEGRIQG